MCSQSPWALFWVVSSIFRSVRDQDHAPHELENWNFHEFNWNFSKLKLKFSPENFSFNWDFQLKNCDFIQFGSNFIQKIMFLINFWSQMMIYEYLTLVDLSLREEIEYWKNGKLLNLNFTRSGIYYPFTSFIQIITYILVLIHNCILVLIIIYITIIPMQGGWVEENFSECRVSQWIRKNQITLCWKFLTT